MAGIISTALSFLVSEKCINKYMSVECFKILLSKCLGYGIVLGATLVKLPQILKLIKSGNAKGLSISAGLLELICCTSTSSYSLYKRFPFSSYGDAVFLAIQTAIISFLTISWEISYLYGTIFLSSYVACVAYTLSPSIDFSLLALAQTVNTPVILFSRGLQIMENWRNGSTGQLSAISVWLMTAGSLARIFTSIQETNDNLIIINFVASSFVNIILTFQIIFYWNSPLPVDPGNKAEGETKKTR